MNQNISPWRPKWKNKDEYPSQCSVNQWQWEFLRRHADYEADYLVYEQWEKDRSSGWGKDEAIYPILAKYQVIVLPNPSLSYEKIPSPIFHGGIEYALFEAGVTHTSHLFANSMDPNGSYAQLPRLEGEGEIVLKVNLQVPTSKNIELIKDVLEMCRKQLHYSELKPELQHFSRYLRILDAKHENANITDREMAEFILNDGKPLASNAQEVNTISSSRTRAEDIRNMDYKYLHLYPGTTTVSRSGKKQKVKAT